MTDQTLCSPYRELYEQFSQDHVVDSVRASLLRRFNAGLHEYLRALQARDELPATQDCAARADDLWREAERLEGLGAQGDERFEPPEIAAAVRGGQFTPQLDARDPARPFLRIRMLIPTVSLSRREVEFAARALAGSVLPEFGVIEVPAVKLLLSAPPRKDRLPRLEAMAARAALRALDAALRREGFSALRGDHRNPLLRLADFWLAGSV